MDDGQTPKCGGPLVRHPTLKGYECARCRVYYDDVWLEYHKMKAPLWCGSPPMLIKAQAALAN